MDQLTKTKQRVLWATAVFAVKNGYAPTFRDICTALDVSSTNALLCHLKGLRKLGFINWADGKSRTLHLTETGWKELVGRDLAKKQTTLRVNVMGRLQHLHE